MDNLYKNLGSSGKNYLDKLKKLDDARAEYAKSKQTSLQEAQDAAEQKRKADFYAAANTYAMPKARARDRMAALNEEMKYNANAPIVGMTEMISQVVEHGLLLDESELEAIYPNYKEEIRETVNGYLKNAEINQNISNQNTLELMEHVAILTPSVDEGKYLTEDELTSLFKASQVHNVDRALKDLGGDVSSRVATLMEKEQKRIDKIDNDVKKASSKNANPNGEPLDTDTVLDMIEKGEIELNDLDDMLKNGEITQDTFDEISGEIEGAGADTAAEDPDADPNMDPNAAGGEEMPQEGDPNADPNMDPNAAGGEEMPQEGDPNAAMAGDPSMAAGAPSATPKKQIQMLPDGTLNVNIYEQYLAEAADSAYVKQSQMANGWSISKQGRYDPEMLTAKGLGMIKSTLGLSLFSLVPFVGLPAAIAAGIRQTKNLEQINSEQYKELRDFVQKEPKCKKIIDKIKIELLEPHPDKNTLEAYKSEFFRALKEAKEKYKKTKLSEACDMLLIDMALEERYKPTEIKTNLIRETPRSGLIEALAVNEAMTQLNEGKEYNPDYCIAKALVYVTITEAMSVMGLMDVNEDTYKKISAAAGGALNENKLTKISVSKKLNRSENLNESYLSTQYRPITNNIKTAGSDLAERIRQKKLLKESIQNLSE